MIQVIGGPLDGRMVECDNNVNLMHIPLIIQNGIAKPPVIDLTKPPPFRKDIYYIERLAIGDEEVFFLLHSSFRQYDDVQEKERAILKTLLAGYRHPLSST